MPQYQIKAPGGALYTWKGPNPPSPEQLRALAAQHAKASLRKPTPNGDPLGDPADRPDYRPPPPLPKLQAGTVSEAKLRNRRARLQKLVDRVDDAARNGFPGPKVDDRAIKAKLAKRPSAASIRRDIERRPNPSVPLVQRGAASKSLFLQPLSGTETGTVGSDSPYAHRLWGVDGSQASFGTLTSALAAQSGLGGAPLSSQGRSGPRGDHRLAAMTKAYEDGTRGPTAPSGRAPWDGLPFGRGQYEKARDMGWNFVVLKNGLTMPLASAVKLATHRLGQDAAERHRMGPEEAEMRGNGAIRNMAEELHGNPNGHRRETLDAYKQRLAEAPLRGLASLTGATPEDLDDGAWGAAGVARFLGGVLASPVVNFGAAQKVATDPVGAAKDIPGIVQDALHSVNVLDPSLSSGERFSRLLNAATIAYGAKHGAVAAKRWVAEGGLSKVARTLARGDEGLAARYLKSVDATMAAKKAGEIAEARKSLWTKDVQKERARLAKANPDSFVRFSNRGKPVNLSGLTDEGLKTVRGKIEARHAQAQATGSAEHVAQEEHNRSVIAAEEIRRAGLVPRPYKGFSPKSAEAQAAAQRAAQRPVATNVPAKLQPSAALWQKASNWLSAARNSPPGAYPAPALGSDILFQGAPKGKLYKGDPVVQALVPHIPDLLQSAELVWLEQPKRSDRSYHSVARLVARALTGDGPVDVWMVIRRNARGDWYYNHQYTRVRPVWFKK